MGPEEAQLVTAAHPARDGRIPLGLGDEVAQQGVGAKEAQADVGGLGEVLQHRRVGEALGARPAVDQGHHNLKTDAGGRFVFARGSAGGWCCTSPFSNGTMREYSVVQIWSSSRSTRALGCFPNLSMHSRFESGGESQTFVISASFVLKKPTCSEAAAASNVKHACNMAALQIKDRVTDVHLSDLSHRNQPIQQRQDTFIVSHRDDGTA